MEKTNRKYQAYIQILKEELHPAMGCTEPIALAYAAAVARRELGCLPDRVVIGASGSIIKNVKSVIVPNTNHLKGIPAAVSAGIVAGDPDKELEVIAEATEEDSAKIKDFLENTPITVEHLDQGITFDIVLTLYHGDEYAKSKDCKLSYQHCADRAQWGSNKKNQKSRVKKRKAAYRQKSFKYERYLGLYQYSRRRRD